MEKIFGNIPVVPFAIVMVLAVIGITIAFNESGGMTGKPIGVVAMPCASNSDCAGRITCSAMMQPFPTCNLATGNCSCTSCSDPDGANLSVKGTCKDIHGMYNDSCFNSTYMGEYVCSAGNCILLPLPVYCGDGKTCANGACNASGGGACIGAGNMSRNPSLGPSGYFGECCAGLVEIPGTPFSAYYPENCTIHGGWAGSGIICSACGNGICDAWEHNCNCPQDCAAGAAAGNASVILISPENNTNFTAPANITFSWTAANFTNSMPLCFPGVLLGENLIFYPMDYQNSPITIQCDNNNECSWISPEMNSSYSWFVSCAENGLAFDAAFSQNDWTNVTISETRSFEMIGNESNATCTPVWIESEWFPEPCEAGDIQTKIHIDQYNCGIMPGEVTCVQWQPENSSCILEQTCTGENYTPSGNKTGCTENWQFVNWSECVNGTKTKIYEDKNNCGTAYEKPADSELQSCNSIMTFLKKFKYYVLAGLAAAILVLVITLSAKHARNKRILKTAYEEQKSEKKEEEKEEKHPEIESYIKKAFIKGLSKAQIKKQLLDAGWPKKAIDDAFSV